MSEVLRTWKRVSALLGNIKVTAWLTTSDWAKLAKEVGELSEEQCVNRPTNSNFKQCYVGTNLLLKNSGTDDQGVVNSMNWVEIGDRFDEFDFRRRTWQTGNKHYEHDLDLPDHPFDA